MDIGTDISRMEGEVRNGFVRKVYSLLSVQLLVTAAIAIPIQQMSPLWIAQHRQYAQVAMLVSLVTVLGVSCCFQGVARRVPYNYIFLFVVTICQSVLVGFLSALYTTQSVVLALILTAGIFFGLTLFALTTKSDFTGCGGYLTAAVWGMILTLCLCSFWPYSPMINILQAGAGAILFSFFIVYDTQLICGGKHEQQFDIDDYVFAALNIYLDIINLFMYIIQLIGDRKE